MSWDPKRRLLGLLVGEAGGGVVTSRRLKSPGCIRLLGPPLGVLLGTGPRRFDRAGWARQAMVDSGLHRAWGLAGLLEVELSIGPRSDMRAR